MNILLGLFNCPFAPPLDSFGCSLDSVLIHINFPGFSSTILWHTHTIFDIILFSASLVQLFCVFLQSLRFLPSALSSSFFFYFFFSVISRRNLFFTLFCTSCFCFLQVCPSITSCSGYMWGSCSQQEANVCTYHNYADFLHFVIDLLLLRSVFILAEQILSRLTQTNWAAMMPFFKPFYSFCFSFFLTVSCLISFLSPTGSNTSTLISSLFPDGLLQYRTTQRITVQQTQYFQQNSSLFPIVGKRLLDSALFYKI